MKNQITSILKEGPSLRLMAAGVLAACVFSLSFAYTAQYGFGFEPCILCLYQRPPYFIAAALGVIALALSRRGTGQSSARILLWLCVLIFVVEATIAFFQVGVEFHWWRGFTGCSGPDPARMTAEEYLAALATAPTVRCDVVQFAIFGISMAGMNALWAQMLATLLAVGLMKTTPPSSQN